MRQQLEEFAASLPGFEKTYAWDCAQFKVAGKLFAWADEEDCWISVKASKEQQAILCEQPNIEPSPYAHIHGWVRITIEGEDDLDMACDLLQEGYSQVVAKLPKKKQAELDR